MNLDLTPALDTFGLAEICVYRGWYEGKTDWPHVFLCVGNKCRGFYPSDNPGKDMEDMLFSWGRILEDDAQYKDRSECSEIIACDEKKLNACVAKCKKPAFYNMLISSCVNFAADCAQKCQLQSCSGILGP